MNDWTELKDLQAVAKAQADGWEIELRAHDRCIWEPWEEKAWLDWVQYRGRPKAERKVVRVREAVMTYGTISVSENEAQLVVHRNTFIGWAVGSKWREVEYEND